MIHKITVRLLSLCRNAWVKYDLRCKGVEVGRNTRIQDSSGIYRWDNAKIIIKSDVTIGAGATFRVSGNGALTLEEGVTINSHCHIECTGVVTIGKNTFLNHGVNLYNIERITIGADAMIGVYTVIADVDHEMARTDIPMRLQGNTTPRPVVIGEGVWLGAKVTVTKGVTVGPGAVVGANAVVTRDIPPLAVAVGIPAKVVRYRGDATS